MGHHSSHRGSVSIAASRSSANCLAAQGWTDQQWSFRRRRGSSHHEERPPNRFNKGAKGRGGLVSESSKLGNEVFQRVHVTTNWLQRLVRGICPGRTGGATALLRVSRDSGTQWLNALTRRATGNHEEGAQAGADVRTSSPRRSTSPKGEVNPVEGTLGRRAAYP